MAPRPQGNQALQKASKIQGAARTGFLTQTAGVTDGRIQRATSGFHPVQAGRMKGLTGTCSLQAENIETSIPVPMKG